MQVKNYSGASRSLWCCRAGQPVAQGLHMLRQLHNVAQAALGCLKDAARHLGLARALSTRPLAVRWMWTRRSSSLLRWRRTRPAASSRLSSGVRVPKSRNRRAPSSETCRPSRLPQRQQGHVLGLRSTPVQPSRACSSPGHCQRGRIQGEAQLMVQLQGLLAEQCGSRFCARHG